MSDRHYQRELERYVPNYIIRVEDASRGIEVGNLVNIHEQGMMMVGVPQVAEDHLYQFQLLLPQTINGRLRVPVGVDCLWVREENGQQWSGFAIIDLSDESRADILSLIEKLT